MKIISKAPTRVSLFGGGTDCNPYMEKHGGAVISMAINLRHVGELTPRDDKWIWIEAMGESRIWRIDKPLDYKIDPKFDLIRAIINSYKLKTGFHYVDTFEGVQGAGLGSSASAAVSMIGAFDRWVRREINPVDIAKRAWKAEAYTLGWYSGIQDQAAAALGGFNHFSFGPHDCHINPTPLRKAMAESLLPWCVLMFTGKTRKSSDIQKVFYEDMRGKVNKGEPLEALTKIKALVDDGLSALAAYDYRRLGKLLDKGWRLKKLSSPLASTERIDKILRSSKYYGAIGGKVLGAGGEGHILFIVPPKQRLRFIDRMENKGLKHIDFSIDWTGLETRVV